MDAPAEPCFHCANAVAAGGHFSVCVNGASHPVCCAGCEAAANLILAQGLGRYYDFRSAGQPVAEGRLQWSVFDRAEALRRYTHLRADGERELSLQVDGLHCAACAWLIENSLRTFDGVRDIVVNTGSARAEIRFDPGRVALSQLLARIHALGYRPVPMSFTAGVPVPVAERRAALKRLAVAGFGMMQVMTYAVSLYAGAMDGIAPDLRQLLRFVSLLVATPVVLYAAQPFFVAAWRGLRMRRLGIDLPVALSIGAAYGWSAWSTVRGEGAVYFDSAVMFTFFLLLSRYVEMSVRHGFGLQHDAIARLLPQSVLRVNAGVPERVIPDELAAGDRVRILPGERIPADGLIVAGQTQVDESLLTGESQLQARVVGDPLVAGALNVSSAIELTLTAVGQDSSLAAVSRLLERARADRPGVAELADAVAAWFVGAVLLMALGVGLYWLHVDPRRAFPTVLAVLVVTCPCALSLATPAALAAATTRLARMGLLVTRGRALAALARVQDIVFDKTGTLTYGRLGVESVQLYRSAVDRTHCLALATALERYSEHPIASAFADPEITTVAADVRSAPGEGVQGRIDGRLYRIGRAEYVQALCGAGTATPPVSPTHSSVWLADEEGWLAQFTLSDELRVDARATLLQLRARGLTPYIASGDRASLVAAVARELGATTALGDLRPVDKVAFVRARQAQGRRVAMVGDGVNDAPVLAAADVSVAIAAGTELAKVSADIVMLGESLGPLCAAVDCARRCRRVMQQNMIWAVLYNATAIPLAASGVLHAWMAAAGMSLSSLLVVFNALRLLRAPSSAPPAAPSSASMTAGIAPA